jgi:phage gpG-like protein
MEATLDVSEWDLFLASLSDKYRNASDYLRLAVETKGRADVLDHFRTSRGPNEAWKPRSWKTQLAYANYKSGRWKTKGHLAKYDPSNLLLVLTGRLRQSIQPAGKEGGVRVLGKDAVMLYSAVEYSRAHDEGIPGRIPQREFMYLSDQGHENVAKVFMESLMEGL